ncbi:MAG: helix-turn-helix domain-containing protein [Paludisphaera borealis]|uniref:helix-turn-helix transcriptional regulator n=1 Tax=Paludisphaera borealis TaxID=1387353 RepID=UPI0028434BD0|nr:helix-turn-helix domain-containing protein [Paludisphaera borealis]MDR3618222.1 helix-turn-helix domain-containing protein [Paludisphaera borealis]
MNAISNRKPATAEPGPAIEPLLSIDDVAAALSCSRRLVERMRSAGKLPRPDLHVGRMPRWKRETLVRWIAEGGRK